MPFFLYKTIANLPPSNFSLIQWPQLSAASPTRMCNLIITDGYSIPTGLLEARDMKLPNINVEGYARSCPIGWLLIWSVYPRFRAYDGMRSIMEAALQKKQGAAQFGMSLLLDSSQRSEYHNKVLPLVAC